MANTQIGAGGRPLSGGQRQRIGLAPAVFGNPAVIILDEPNANLDGEGKEALLQVIGDLKAKMKAVIFISHEMSLVALAEKTLVLADGRVRSLVRPRTFSSQSPPTRVCPRWVAQYKPAKLLEEMTVSAKSQHPDGKTTFSAPARRPDEARDFSPTPYIEAGYLTSFSVSEPLEPGLLGRRLLAALWPMDRFRGIEPEDSSTS